MDIEQVPKIIMQEGVKKTCSILPYSIEPYTKSVFMLLGKESGNFNDLCNNFNNDNTINKEDWCEFGGSKIENESDEQAAARECVEESIGTIKYWETKTNDDNNIYENFSQLINKLTKDLENGKYAQKITFCLNHGAPETSLRKYQICFVKQVPWQPEIQKNFTNRYNKLKNMTPTNNNNDFFQKEKILFQNVICPETKLPKKEYMEKNDITYWNIEFLSNLMRTNKCHSLRALFVPLLCIVMYHFGVLSTNSKIIIKNSTVTNTIAKKFVYYNVKEIKIHELDENENEKDNNYDCYQYDYYQNDYNQNICNDLDID